MTYLKTVTAKTFWDGKTPDKTKLVKGWIQMNLYGNPNGKDEYHIVAFDKKTGKHVGTFDIIPPEMFARRMNWRDKRDWTCITISNAYVNHEYQRKGIGTAVYDWAGILSKAEAVPYEDYDGGEQPMSEDAKDFWRKRSPGTKFYSDDENDEEESYK